jgi:DNA polymerase III delta subunit
MLLRQEERRITTGDVTETVGYSPTASIWEWTDAILDQDTARAVDLLEDLLEKGEQPVYCIAVLAKQYEKMIWTKEMVGQRVPHAVIAQKINKPLYYLGKYLDQLARFTMEDLVKALQVLAYTDRAMKSTPIPEKTILHVMTAQLCNLKAPPGPVFDIPVTW